MDTTEILTDSTIAAKEQGFFSSSTINLTPEEARRMYRDKAHLEKALEDLPDGVKNFLNLLLVSESKAGPDGYEIQWQNQGKGLAQGHLILRLAGAPGGRGTTVVAQAAFDSIDFKTDGPSTLIHILLRRLKALAETGELPTTKGQPSGREEIQPKILN